MIASRRVSIIRVWDACRVDDRTGNFDDLWGFVSYILQDFDLGRLRFWWWGFGDISFASFLSTGYLGQMVRGRRADLRVRRLRCRRFLCVR